MKASPVSWLIPALLGSQAAASTLDQVRIAVLGDKLSGGESAVLSGKAITYPQRIRPDEEPQRRDGVPRESAGTSNPITIDLNTPSLILFQNQTKNALYIPPPPSDILKGPSSSPIIVHETASAPPNQSQQQQQDPPTQQTAAHSPLDHDPGPAAAAAAAAEAEAEAEAASATISRANVAGAGSNSSNSPAPANRAIAGMGAGLLGVMVIFTVFL
ncbi:8c35f1ea-50d8-4263-8cc3-5a53b4da314f [Thermothielavioides terrestris]|uniref:Uncharacterized protein n=2 Tax=Thermothielavioides terrestris TaxID=2587410 RepID=G2RI60_THETT|nr:uncharacterized protein THITE_2123997 [Thermothielavioides terrestris NRRL 8126]AEO71522.1 hypothetical protein THITE_2123997 [Thermothielavioides terrestris NRRL 8126]SPQ27498.1 8c35f1ea-50d8-4263-8cc3-5a53b4da314f [Thermothielavioides terrestris]